MQYRPTMSVLVQRLTTGIARLRPKNQLTVPEEALVAVGAKVGTRFVVTVERGAIRLDPVLESYAGVFRDVFPADSVAEVRAERDSWER
jgi:hypothetical protein